MKRARRPVEYLFPAVLLLLSGAALANNTASPVNLPSLAVSVFGLAAGLCFFTLRAAYPVFSQIWLYAQLLIVKEVHTLPTGENSRLSMERVYLDATQSLHFEINIGLDGDRSAGSLYLGINLLAIAGAWLFHRHMASVTKSQVAASGPPPGARS